MLFFAVKKSRKLSGFVIRVYFKDSVLQQFKGMQWSKLCARYVKGPV